MSVHLLLLSAWMVAPRAQTQASPIPNDEGTTEIPVVYKGVTDIGEDEFLELDIEGELVRPIGIYDVNVVHQPMPAWIVLRTSFDPELQASLEEIR